MQETIESPGFRGVPLDYQERRIYHWNEEVDRRIGIERVPPELRSSRSWPLMSIDHRTRRRNSDGQPRQVKHARLRESPACRHRQMIAATALRKADAIALTTGPAR
jgi:hypothetical protein